MEAFLEGTEPDEATLKALIRKGTISLAFVPVTCGSAFKNKGVQPMLDAVCDYLPSPLDLPDMKGSEVDDPEKAMTRPPSDDAPFSGLAFKIMTDPFVGSLTFLRIYSGTLASGTYVLNAAKGKKERIGRLLEMHANRCVTGHLLVSLLWSLWVWPIRFGDGRIRARCSVHSILVKASLCQRAL